MCFEYYSIAVKLVQEEAIIDMLHILLHTANQDSDFMGV
jgi:hypothetical protein